MQRRKLYDYKPVQKTMILRCTTEIIVNWQIKNFYHLKFVFITQKLYIYFDITKLTLSLGEGE